MHSFKAKILLSLILVSFSFVNTSSIAAIDKDLHESVLDAEECRRQTTIIRSTPLLAMQFADAGIRTPKGILNGNSIDLGNYHQCLGIAHPLGDMQIQGKYCLIQIPMDQNFTIPISQEYEWSTFNPASLALDAANIDMFEKQYLYNKRIQALSGIFDDDVDERSIGVNPLAGTVFSLSMCLPKQCTTQEVLPTLIFNIIGLKYTDSYCRFSGDKPWSGADTAAVIVFSIVGFLTLLSTCYDLCYRFVFRKDIKNVNVLYQSCSVYTNGQRLMTFSSGSGNLNCVDGIRSISMIWIIVAHAFGTEPVVLNMVEYFMWIMSAESLWLHFGHVAVDTFFVMSGILLVYTTAAKMNGMTLLKNLHWFYLGRIVRITPLLAVAVLLQASYFNHMTDGPVWTNVETQTNHCRKHWWSTLLNIQNWTNPRNICVAHSWYVAIDIQLYFLSPLVLFWVLGGKKRTSLLALIGALLAVLIGSTVYIFHLNVPSGLITPARLSADYMPKYYLNTLSRASPFFVGLIFGYILHVNRKKKLELPWGFPLLSWTLMSAITGALLYFNYAITQLTWDNEFLDSFMNSFMRPAWAMCVGLLIFNCVHGYGGPVNWFLSLEIWRLPGRLSYAMYLFHYPLMFSLNAALIMPFYFNVGLLAFKSLAYITLSLMVSFFLTLLFDMPFMVLYRQLTTAVLKKKHAPIANKTNKPDSNSHLDNPNNETKIDEVIIGKETNGLNVTVK